MSFNNINDFPAHFLVNQDLDTLRDLAGVEEKPKRHKYGAQKTVVDGITFDSKREAQRYQELLLLEQSHKISHLLLQPKYTLQEAFTDKQGNKHGAITYKADFAYYDDLGFRIVEDVKGVETAVFKLKKKLFIKRYPHLILRITK